MYTTRVEMESPSKRPRSLMRDDRTPSSSSQLNEMMVEAESNKDYLLNCLNEDCWRAVLQFVPVQDVIRTERASRWWQEVVLTYLRGVHITIVDHNDSNPNTCKGELSENTLKSFESWTQKLGPSVVATYCNSLGSLEVIKKNCPNIVALKLVHVDCRVADELMPYNLTDNFKSLQKLTFNYCPFTDVCISQFVADRALEELELSSCDNVTGLFFNSINLSKLNSLVLHMCRGLQANYVLPAIDRLSELRKLMMVYIPYEILEEIQLVLDKMLKLEWLELYDDILRMGCESSAPLSRLTKLKRLVAPWQLGDDDVEDVTRCCQELTTLDLMDCQGMTSLSVGSLCRNAGARLVSLSLGTFYEAEDDEVVALVRGCPKLTFLCVASTGSLTPALPARAAAARVAGPRLVLDLSYTNLADEEERYNNVEGGAEEYGEMQTEYEFLSVKLN